MTERNYSANAKRTTLSSGVSAVDTTIPVTDNTATLNYPAVPFTIVVDKGTQNEEIMTVTAVSSLSLTVTRAPEGNAATTHSAGATLAHAVTARDFVDSQSHVYDTTNVHGVGAGSVVGTSTTQTLTNKTLTDPVIGVSSVTAASDFTPRGMLAPYAGATAPNGWLICDGQAVSRTTYSALFAVISTTYGSGDGSTTFQIPNLKGRTIFGYDASNSRYDTMAKATSPGATADVTLIEANIPSHRHTISHTHGMTSSTHSHSITDGAGSHSHGGSTTGGASYSYIYNVDTWNTVQGGGAQTAVRSFSNLVVGHNHTISSDGGHNHGVNGDGNHSHSTNSQSDSNSGYTGSGTAVNVQNPYITMQYIIKY